MVYAQRLGEWMTNAPQIEEDMALGNIALDLLGQARGLYPYVGSIDGTGRGEDDYAMQRDEREWHNVHLVEQERGDFADEMARLLWFSAYQVELHTALPAPPTTSSRASRARRSRRCATTSTTPRSGSCASATGPRSPTPHAGRPRPRAALPRTSSSTTTRPSVLAARLGVGVLPSTLHAGRRGRVARVVEQATLTLPDGSRWRSRGGRAGIHSRPMGYLLAEMQHIARSHPGATW